MDEKNNVRNSFLEELGAFIRAKRLRKNMSQDDVAFFLGVTGSAVNRYESGDVDMKVSNLPLLSICCDFSMRNCFSSMETVELVNNFRQIANIKRTRYQREYERKHSYEGKRKLKAQIYEVDGKEVTEYILRKDKDELSLREKYARGDIELAAVPFDDEEFGKYIQDIEQEEIRNMLDGAGKVLDFIGNAEKKETIKATIADFVIDNLIVDKVMNEQRLSVQRAYMYYKKLLDWNGDEWGGPLR